MWCSTPFAWSYRIVVHCCTERSGMQSPAVGQTRSRWSVRCLTVRKRERRNESWEWEWEWSVPKEAPRFSPTQRPFGTGMRFAIKRLRYKSVVKLPEVANRHFPAMVSETLASSGSQVRGLRQYCARSVLWSRSNSEPLSATQPEAKM
jgi:hypothetical protein